MQSGADGAEMHYRRTVLSYRRKNSRERKQQETGLLSVSLRPCLSACDKGYPRRLQVLFRNHACICCHRNSRLAHHPSQPHPHPQQTHKVQSPESRNLGIATCHNMLFRTTRPKLLPNTVRCLILRLLKLPRIWNGLVPTHSCRGAREEPRATGHGTSDAGAVLS
ncbi:uncharacterized protein BO72DRAFT_197817 [Aspergillus fijiensis CBS 313.89]|uniref:Uncharacterized protein n=1 Tax=Aspergillus fijiensis CBS 313.89 TaxID=1448319 RepID=A0A8G1RNI9_9EURO|nr:uncharacterized protein BO72DRAFT_197817 [Aspergillus fijiensis CBS 313.89]RAK74651.1 hypothetical protein BO72DRAFT_197817 [Aspergillus fijiensis CBS 313.89]